MYVVPTQESVNAPPPFLHLLTTQHILEVPRVCGHFPRIDRPFLPLDEAELRCRGCTNSNPNMLTSIEM
jgi:hypothetical protein